MLDSIRISELSEALSKIHDDAFLLTSKNMYNNYSDKLVENNYSR